MAISTSVSFFLHSPRNQLLCLSSPSDRQRFVSTFSLPALLQRRQSLSHRPCCSSAPMLQQKHLRAEDLEEELIDAIGKQLSSLEMGSVDESLHEALMLVDLIQGLGIQRFFKHQIESILRSAYMQWNEKDGLIDANFTVLGFRLLRLQGYHVCGDVLKTLKDKDDGNFSTFLMTADKISGLLNLYKCSQIGFPQETEIMREAQDFARTQLTGILSDVKSFNLLDKQREEIEFSLAFPRQFLLSRMEARSIVRRLWPSNGLRRKCLELACIDLEVLQQLYQQEIYEMERWLDKQRLEELQYPRNRLVKLFIGAAMSMFEPQFSFYRATVTKISCLVATMDDLFDLPTCDYQGLYRLQEAFRRWDASLIENLPQHKAIFKSFHQNLTEIAGLASKTQGRDVLPYLKEVWKDLAAAFTKEAEWRLLSYVPSLEDYLPVATTSVTAIASLTTFIFILGEPITDEILQFIGKDSRFLYLASLISRLANDIATNEDEVAEGKLCNAVGCYMKDHPDSTKEDAINAIKEMIKASFAEMEQVMFAYRGIVPDCCIRAVLGWVQAICITYRKLDGYKSTMDTEYEELVKDYMGY